jgi:secretion/DNA translocation related TadE-like protein
MIAVLLLVTGVGARLGSVVVARHRAQAAADLAALAAAARLPQGGSAACARATVVAREMRVGGIECQVDGLDVIVTAEVPVAFTGVAKAFARAGPSATAPTR